MSSSITQFQDSSERPIGIFLGRWLGASAWKITLEIAPGKNQYTVISQKNSKLVDLHHVAFRKRMAGKPENQELPEVSSPVVFSRSTTELGEIIDLVLPSATRRPCFATIAWRDPETLLLNEMHLPRLSTTMKDFVDSAVAERAERLVSRTIAKAVEQLNIACVIADGRGNVLFRNHAAAALIPNSAVCSNTGRLYPTSALAQLLRRVAADDWSAETPLVGSGYRIYPLQTGQDVVRPAYASRLSVDPMRKDGGAESACYAIFVPYHEIGLDARTFEIGFGLTPAEARLAAQIVQGRSIQEAAEALSLREQSARTYLKRVYSKLGISRQAELGAIASKLFVPVLGALVLPNVPEEKEPDRPARVRAGGSRSQSGVSSIN